MRFLRKVWRDALWSKLVDPAGVVEGPLLADEALEAARALEEGGAVADDDDGAPAVIV
jgi:hypothetical protein